VHLFDKLRRSVRLAGEGDEFEQIIYGYALRFVFAFFLLCGCLAYWCVWRSPRPLWANETSMMFIAIKFELCM